MKLAIIIVSYSTANLTCQAIQSCVDTLRDDAALLNQTEIVVVDNASTDNSLEKIQQQFSVHIAGISPKLRCIASPTNDGFAVAPTQSICTTCPAV
jgi:GT2 family glycosyltransferase